MHRRAHHRIIPICALAALLAVPSITTAPAAAGPRRVTQVSVKEFNGQVVIGIVATGQILFQVTEITNPLPPRVAIDILDAVVDDRVRLKTDVHKGNVLRVRVGQFQDSPAITRVVVDLVRPVSVEVQRSAPNTLAVSVPWQPVTANGAPAAAPVPTAPAATPMVPAVSAAPGTGIVRVAQQPLPTSPQAPGLIRLLEFRGVGLSDVLTALAKLCGYNIVTDASVQGTVTLRLVDVTCEESLRFVLEANGLGYRRLGKNLIIGSAEKLAPPPEVPETIAYRLAYGDVNQIRAAVAAAVPGIRVSVDPRTNGLLITGTTAQHQEVVKVLGTLDVRIPQVVIQVHAIEVSSTGAKDLGLLGGEGKAASDDDPNPTPLGAQQFGRVMLDSAGNALNFTLNNASIFFFRLRALVTEGQARVLSAPRVATLDGNKATVVLGQRVPTFTQVTVGGQLQTVVNYVDVGVKLEVTPRVNSDQLITLVLKPEVSTLGARVPGPGGQEAFILNTRTAETNLIVDDGRTISVAGLISRDERLTTIKVPLLGDIPILGELFKTTNSERTETEVIFLITPQIVKE